MLFHLLKDRVLFICLLLGSLLAGPVQVVRQDSVIHRAAGACEDGTHVCDCPAHFTVAGLPEGLAGGHELRVQTLRLPESRSLRPGGGWAVHPGGREASLLACRRAPVQRCGCTGPVRGGMVLTPPLSRLVPHLPGVTVSHSARS